VGVRVWVWVGAWCFDLLKRHFTTPYKGMLYKGMSLYIVCLKWEIIWIFCILFARTGQVDLASIVVHELGIESGQASHVMFCCFYRSSQTWRGEQQTKTVRWCPSPLCCYWGAPPLYATMLELDAGLQLSTRTHWNCCWGALCSRGQANTGMSLNNVVHVEATAQRHRLTFDSL
jgi:hypothetical protein